MLRERLDDRFNISLARNMSFLDHDGTETFRDIFYVKFMNFGSSASIAGRILITHKIHKITFDDLDLPWSINIATPDVDLEEHVNRFAESIKNTYMIIERFYKDNSKISHEDGRSQQRVG